jgi:hypothetical protein
MQCRKQAVTGDRRAEYPDLCDLAAAVEREDLDALDLEHSAELRVAITLDHLVHQSPPKWAKHRPLVEWFI